jgi:hypothetical protein
MFHSFNSIGESIIVIRRPSMLDEAEEWTTHAGATITVIFKNSEMSLRPINDAQLILHK